MKRRIAFAAGVFACAMAAVSAQTLPAGVQKGPSMGGITQYDFPNGLKVLLYPDSAEPKITINVSSGLCWASSSTLARGSNLKCLSRWQKISDPA